MGTGSVTNRVLPLSRVCRRCLSRAFQNPLTRIIHQPLGASPRFRENRTLARAG